MTVGVLPSPPHPSSVGCSVKLLWVDNLSPSCLAIMTIPSSLMMYVKTQKGATGDLLISICNKSANILWYVPVEIIFSRVPGIGSEDQHLFNINIPSQLKWTLFSTRIIKQALFTCRWSPSRYCTVSLVLTACVQVLPRAAVTNCSLSLASCSGWSISLSESATCVFAAPIQVVIWFVTRTLNKPDC